LCGHNIVDTYENINTIRTKTNQFATNLLHNEAPINQQGIENHIGQIIKCPTTNQFFQIQQNWNVFETVHKVSVSINVNIKLIINYCHLIKTNNKEPCCMNNFFIMMQTMWCISCVISHFTLSI
jgi:hypothetical protein